MKKTLLWLLAFTVGAAPAIGSPYWMAWEGNDYPENEGWERRVNGEGPAVRTLADGIMNIDGLWSTQVDDFYRMNRPLNPEPGEMFVMQWRVRVNEVVGHPLYLYDPGLSIDSDDDWALALTMGVDRIRSFHEDVVITFEPGLFHVFEVRSSDMRTYELQIDGVAVLTGSLWEPSFAQSRINWGDKVRGSASNSDWDYVRFGVVPEPGTGFLLLALMCSTRAFRQSRRMT